MMVWLVRGNGRNILVDSGFYREQFMRQWHPVDYVKPSEAVSRAGLKPEDITDVIITHMHWDHADGMDLFPKGADLDSEGRATVLRRRSLAEPRTPTAASTRRMCSTP